MKHQFKRGLSMMLVLVVIVSLLSGLTIPVHAAGEVYNWGYRGTVCTELSDAAVEFYNDNDTSYEALAAYKGSSTVSSVPSSALYAQLKDLMVSNHYHYTSYEEVKDLCMYTDCQGGGGKISSFYSGAAVGPTWDGSWNREHTWPNSKGLGGSDENDIMMLRPTSYSENTSRGNTAYGEGSDYYHPNSESDGKYDLRGDVARIVLYVYTRWSNTSYMWGKDGVMESKDVLLSWMEADPVDTWEMGRNDSVESITGTRNVYVDYPELAFLLFGEEVPSDMTTPSGKAGESYKITAIVNDSTMGSVSVSGTNINASPAEGYMVSGYEVVSGAAAVTRNGNTFKVEASSDCTIKIIFAPREQVTVTYMSNGTKISEETAYSGDTITLPTPPAPEAGYTALGWSDATVSHTDKIPAYYKSGESYTVSGNTTLYTLFSYVAAGEGGSGIWTLVTDASQLKAGAQIVLAENATGFVAAPISGSNAYLSNAATEFSADKTTIPTLPDGAQIFTLGGSAGAWTLANASGKLLGATAVKKLAFGSGTTTWKITISGNNATVENTNSSCGRFLYNVDWDRFTTYTSDSNTKMLLPQLYMLSSGETTYYTTETCKHENTENVAAVPATCTEDGYTAGVYCNDCETYISGHETVPATGHSYESEVTPPTATEDGYTTYTCPACGDSYVGDEVPALGESYTVSFSVPDGVTAIKDMLCNNAGITLPVAESPDSNYTFIGWATSPVNNSSTEPNHYKGGDSYVAVSDVTLYALYLRSEGGTGEKAYVLVEKASQLVAGSNIVIAAADDNVALSTTQTNNNRTVAAITKNADKTITLTDGVAELVLGEGLVDGTWSFYCDANGGYLYAASSSSNHMRTKAALDENGSFKIQIGSGGAATVTAQGDKTHNQLRYNSGNDIFSCYASGQKAVCFYIETVDGTVTYTTNISHVHSGVYKEAVPATCTAPGTVAHYSCSCGRYFSDSACTEELATIVDPQKAHAFTAEKAEEKYLKTEANCETAAVYYVSCAACGTSSKGMVSEDTFTTGSADPENHTGQTRVTGKVDATCTTAGYTGDTYCEGCDEKLSTGETIPAGHNMTYVEGFAATHEKDGKKDHYKCNGCDKLFADDKGTTELAPEDVILKAIGHTYGDYKSNTTKHWKECSCGSKTEEGEHTYGKWETVKKASVGVAGEKKRACTVCGYTQTEKIPATSSPGTGDNAHLGLWLLAMALSACGLFLLVFVTPKKGKYLR